MPTSPASRRSASARGRPAFLSACVLATLLVACQGGSGGSGGPSAGTAVGSGQGPTSSSSTSIEPGASSVGGTAGGTGGSGAGDATLLQAEFDPGVAPVRARLLVHAP